MGVPILLVTPRFTPSSSCGFVCIATDLETLEQEARERKEMAARDLEVKKAEYQASVNQKKADADLAYDLQRFKTQRALPTWDATVLALLTEAADAERRAALRIDVSTLWASPVRALW